MKQVIESNSSETITVVTDTNRLSIKQEFKSLSSGFCQYKVMILNKDEVKRLQVILNQWLLNGGLK